jgi:hypothetical protein
VAAELRVLVPAPGDPDLPRLEAEATRHRRLLVRAGAVIAVSTVVSVGGALLIHMCLGGVVAVGLLYSPPAWTGGGHALVGAPDNGGSPGGFMVLGDGPDDNAPPAAEAPTAARVMPKSAAVGVPSVSDLPPLPEKPAAARATEMAAPLMPALPSMGLGTVQVSGVKSGPTAPESSAVTSEDTRGVVGAGPRGTGAGDGGGDEDRPLGLFRGDGNGGRGGGGRGRGIGSGHGNGIDRGMSAADREAHFLGFRDTGFKLQVPPKYQDTLNKHPVTVTISISAEGAVTDVRVVDSCGIAEVDEMWRTYVLLNARFTPEYHDGKPVASELPFSFGKVD